MLQSGDWVKFTPAGGRKWPGEEIIARRGDIKFKVSQGPGKCDCLQKKRGDPCWTGCPSRLVFIEETEGFQRKVPLLDLELVAMPAPMSVPAML